MSYRNRERLRYRTELNFYPHPQEEEKMGAPPGAVLSGCKGRLEGLRVSQQVKNPLPSPLFTPFQAPEEIMNSGRKGY